MKERAITIKEGEKGRRGERDVGVANIPSWQNRIQSVPLEVS